MIDPSEVLYHMFLVWNEDIPLREMQLERVFFLYLSFLAVVADNASLLISVWKSGYVTGKRP